MAEQDLIRIARGILEAFNQDDFERMAAPMTSDGVYNELGTQRKLRGAAEMIEAMKGWKQAMPDAKGTITNEFASGNKVVLEITWEGTHTGPLESPGGTIPPSGKRQVTPASWMLDFEGEKVREIRHYFDVLTLLQQIGAAPK